MRIALLISSLHLGGAQRVATVVANYWAANGHQVTIYTLSGPDDKPFYPLDDAVHQVPLDISHVSASPLSGLINNIRRVRLIGSELTRNRPDVLVSFMDTTNVLAVLAARRIGVPVVVSERTNPVAQDLGVVWRRLRDWAYGMADVVVVQTDRARLSFPPAVRNRAVVIPNPVRPPCPGRKPPAMRLPKPNVLAMGRLSPEKGFDLLIDAFSRVASRHPGWRLVIVGEGPDRGRLEGLATETGLQDRILLPGHATRSGSILRQGDIFALTSLREGFPNALCEAMARGLPAVSFDCPFGPSEIIRDGVDGVIVPHLDLDSFAATLDRLMFSGVERARLALRAPEIVERFGLETVMGMWDEVLR